ncbi:SCO family protein [Ectothiorhodospiraceae bacterium 2226]|nr:SCO family protein [Ectothiorhodospiraceae bacterium 2226]
MRTALAALLILAAGVPALWGATDGLRAFTAEEARRLAVREAPRPLPPLALQGREGADWALTDWAGRTVVVNFIYTRCPTVCNDLGDAMQRLQARLEDDGPGRLGGKVMLLSISFDPYRDTPRMLTGYAERFGAGPHWQVARPREAAELPAVLRAFGITVIPDGYGGYEHNAALHVVDRAGRLAYITDLEDVDGVVRVLEAML